MQKLVWKLRFGKKNGVEKKSYKVKSANPKKKVTFFIEIMAPTSQVRVKKFCIGQIFVISNLVVAKHLHIYVKHKQYLIHKKSEMFYKFCYYYFTFFKNDPWLHGFGSVAGPDKTRLILREGCTPAPSLATVRVPILDEPARKFSSSTTRRDGSASMANTSSLISWRRL